MTLPQSLLLATTLSLAGLLLSGCPCPKRFGGMPTQLMFTRQSQSVKEVVEARDFQQDSVVAELSDQADQVCTDPQTCLSCSDNDVPDECCDPRSWGFGGSAFVVVSSQNGRPARFQRGPLFGDWRPETLGAFRPASLDEDRMRGFRESLSPELFPIVELNRFKARWFVPLDKKNPVIPCEEGAPPCNLPDGIIAPPPDECLEALAKSRFKTTEE